jgi:PAS domain S-box-containing protein
MLEFKKSILLVEDEAVIAMTTAKALEQEYEVMTVFKGEEAIESVGSGIKVDLILMDINLGSGMDGTEAAEIILRDRHIPVVFLSSHTEKEVIAKTEKITSYGYVVKDTSYTVLHASIKMAFKLYEARRTISENEKKYRILNERFHLAVCSANIGIWDLDVPQNKLVWDDRMCQLYGIQKEDFSSDFESWEKCFYPEDADHFYSAMQMALHGEKEFDTEFRIVRPDGTIRNIKAFARVLKDERGRPVRMTGINYDITEKKQAEDNLRESEQQYREIFNSTTNGIFLLEMTQDRHFKIVRFNPAEERMVGLSVSEVEGRLVDDIVSAKTAAALNENYRRCIEGEENITYEEKLDLPAGCRFFRTTLTPVKDHNGLIKRISGIAEDITEYKRAEEALRESETLYRTVIETSPDAIILSNVKGQIILANQQAAALHGYEHEQELIGKCGFDLIAPKDRQRAIENTPKSVKAGTIGKFDYTLLRKDGSHFIGEFRAGAILDANGKPRALISVVRDISERKSSKIKVKNH